MTATIFMGLCSVLFACLARYKNCRWGLKISFLLIFLFLALRYDFGNDYQGYGNFFIEVSQCDQVAACANKQHFEIGWLWLNWLFRSFGFFAMLATLALITCAVYYRFIQKYVPPRYYWLAVFIYVFYPDFMLIHASAMRQSLAIVLFIFALDYLYKKDAIRYLLCVGLASLFHFSALILLPVYLLGLFNWKINRATGMILVSIFGLLVIFSASFAPYLKEFISCYFEKYAGYQDEGAFNTGLGFIYFTAMFLLTINFARLQTAETSLIFKIAMIGFMLMPLNLIIDLFGRVGMYFAPATIVAYPIILNHLKSHVTKVGYLATLVVFTTYKFFEFFSSEIWKDFYGVYQTIFSAPQWY